MLATHIVIPDTQVKPGMPIDHLEWIGHFIVDKYGGRPNVKIVHLGDHWDMPSLSKYDEDTEDMWNRRVEEDIAAGNAGMELLDQALNEYNATRRRYKERRWTPERHLLRGNHEDRITRYINHNPKLRHYLGLERLLSPGWEVHDYLQVLHLDGVAYSHYFYNPMTGRPFGGQAITRLKTIGRSFVQGHQQTYDVAVRFVDGKAQRALICGTCYLHDEKYLGPQGNSQWRGIFVLHEVRNGSYNLLEVSLDYLCRKYEGREIEDFLREKYGMEYMSGLFV